VKKLLILIGVALVVAGLCWNGLSKLPLGRLPGDLLIERPGYRIFLPITTLVVISLALNAVLWIARRL
jgi:Protein of unknown function (DUF2905)